MSPLPGEISIFTLVFPTSYIKGINVEFWLFLSILHQKKCISFSGFVCVQAVLFWKHSVWYTHAVFICKFINGSQFPMLIFLMLCQRKLSKLAGEMYTVMGPFVLTEESWSVITFSLSAFKSKSQHKGSISRSEKLI